jgi:hypothetical protein
VTACAFSSGGFAISASADRTLKVWDLASAKERLTLAGHKGPVTACAVTPNGRYIVSASLDRTLAVWDPKNNQQVSTLHGDAAFRAVAATDRSVVAGDDAGNVWLLDFPGRPETSWDFFIAHPKPAVDAAIELYQCLERRQRRVFLDAKSLLPGSFWPIEIPHHLSATRVLVVLISAAHPDAAYYHHEIQIGIERWRADKTLRVVPVFLDGPLPKGTAVPFGLGGFTWIDTNKVGGIEGVAEKLDDQRIISSSP